MFKTSKHLSKYIYLLQHFYHIAYNYIDLLADIYIFLFNLINLNVQVHKIKVLNVMFPLNNTGSKQVTG